MQRRRLFGGLAAALVLAVPALATQQQEPGGRPHQASSPAVRTIQPKQTLDRADDHAQPHPGDDPHATARSVLYGVLQHSGAELSAQGVARQTEHQG